MAEPDDILDGDIGVLNHYFVYLQQRRELGLRRYGTPLHVHNGRNPLHDALAEAADLGMYLSQKILEDEERLPRGDDADDKPVDEVARLTPLAREREGIEAALRNLVFSLEGRRVANERMGSGAAAQENEIAIDAIEAILANPTAALQD